MPDATRNSLPDYYEILQVSPTADPKVIQDAHWRLVEKWHAERRPGDRSAFDRLILLDEAADVLTDPGKRRVYDARRSASSPTQAATVAVPEQATSLPKWPLAVLAAVGLVFCVVVLGRPAPSSPPTTRGPFADALDYQQALEATKASGAEVRADDGGADHSAHVALSADELFARVSPAVVRVITRDRQGHELGSGSGFLVQSSGLVVTNFHVIEEAYSLNLRRADGTAASVEGVASFDEGLDLAILKVPAGAIQARPLKISSLSMPAVGTKVYAIGNPLGLTNSLSDGLVSGHRTHERQSLIQTTSPISPGSSGGPLLSADGRVAGVTTFIAKNGQGLNFAVSASHLRELLARSGTTQPLPLPSARLAAAARERAKRLEDERTARARAYADRESRNKQRAKAILEAIEALDSKVRFSSSKDEWRRLTNGARLQRIPTEWERERLMEFLVKWDMDELAEQNQLERAAREAGLTQEEWRRRRNYPLPEDHKSGYWKQLRENLIALEY